MPNDPGDRNGQSKKSKPPTPTTPGPTRADKALVDRWLKENLDDANYEVVKWYGPEYKFVPTKQLEKEQVDIWAAVNRADIQGDQEGIDKGYVEYEKWRLKCNEASRKAVAEARKNNSEPRVIGLKYRCTQRLVGKILMRTAFEIKDGHAAPCAGDLDHTTGQSFGVWFPNQE